MKIILAIALIFLIFTVRAQNISPLDESATPPVGITFQNGTSSWTYPYGAKLSVWGSVHRNFEIMNTHKTSTSTLSFRTYNGNSSSWSSWRELLYQNSDGKVGIGTISPRFNLDIKTNNTFEGNNIYFGDRRFYLAGITGTGSQMYGGMVLTNQGSGVRSLNFVIGNNDFDSNKSPENVVMRVKSNGKVGIGTDDTGSHQLAVEGSIGAREIKVEAFPNWSDFVFEEKYALPTLAEVENHIKENGHLKDIPSAEDVKNDGIYLGQMDAKLLQKIEELTLYLIEQNKQNVAQQARILQLENKLSQLVDE